MSNERQMKEALEAVHGCAKKPKYEHGILITHAAYQGVKAALGMEELAQFADKRFGCATCGAYADPDTKKVEHIKGCTAVSEEPPHV